jgi:aminopeptidase N
MEKDSVETSHPVSMQELDDPREVQQYFDEISYDKVNLKNLARAKMI